MSLRSLALALAPLVLTWSAASPSAQEANPVVVMETSLGTITIELYKDQAVRVMAVG